MLTSSPSLTQYLSFNKTSPRRLLDQQARADFSSFPNFKNELARLRHQIYLQRTGDEHIDRINTLGQLGSALLGPETRESAWKALRAAALLFSESSDQILVCLEDSGTSNIVDRYLADALLTHPQILEEVRSQDALRKKLSPSLEQLITSPTKTLIEENPTQAIAHPVTLVQCMFYGDPSRSGRGSSGGIATLLNELGNTIPEEAGGVVTLVLYDTERSPYPFVPVEQISKTHSIIRVPVTLLEPAPQGFLLGREKLMRALESALKQHNLTPKVIHVRFLDDASLAAGRLAKKIGAKLVATITPDPHRQLCDLSGNIRRFTEEEALTYLNKILIGDMLVEMADGILAIGKKTIEKELLPYYPQLEDTRGRLIQGIDEGVRSFIKTENLNLQDLLLDNDLKYSLSPQNWDRPTLLCIGRLAGIKNQPALLKAWSHSLWEEYNLVFIGGDHTNPTEEEKTILIGIDEVLIEKPEIRGSFVHLPGRSNHDIRNIQKFFAGSNRGKPHFYICPSLKEEFGLSILEAMSVGMVVCAPLKGGAGTYIRHGINGFLIDTSSKQTLQAELEGLILGNRLSPSKAFAIGENAARTVSEQYSMETIAGEFADFYRRVIDG